MKLQNLKTTAMGVLTLLSAAAAIGVKFLAHKAITPDDMLALSAALSGIGLVFSKDHNA